MLKPDKNLEEAIKTVFDDYVIKFHDGRWGLDLINIFNEQKRGFTRNEVGDKLKELVEQHKISDKAGRGSRMVFLDKPKDGG